MSQALREEKRKLRLNNEKSKSSEEPNSDGKIVSVESVNLLRAAAFLRTKEEAEAEEKKKIVGRIQIGRAHV